MHSPQPALSQSVIPQKNCVVILGPHLRSAIPRAQPRNRSTFPSPQTPLCSVHSITPTEHAFNERGCQALPTLVLYVLLSSGGVPSKAHRSQTKRRSPRGGRELCRKCAALLGKQQECGTKVTATAQGRQMKAGSILHYVV